MTKHVPRQAFVTASAAALAGSGVAALPVFAQSEPEAELLAAIAEYRESQAAFASATDAEAEAVTRYHALGAPPIPEELFARPEDEAFCIHGGPHIDYKDGRGWYTATIIEKLEASPRTRRVERKPVPGENGREWEDYERIVSYEPWPEAQARADEIVAASKRPTAEERRRRDVSGFTEATAAYDAARERHYASLERIAAVRAKTPRGAALKTAVVARGYQSDPEELEAEIRREDYGLEVRVALSTARDLSQMVGVPVS